ncbi:type III PLP-dependent enzyme [Kitasatospora putterlickiae]|uniref:ornithine decarboxylase n=1 Tax=Kitasatospora putterlickiae TaxID=221725 RepID=A0ABN1YAI4_9ACTN
MPDYGRLRAALAATDDDRIVFDLDGIEAQYDALLSELPGVDVRFAMKACPVDEVLACLAARGAGFDAAGPQEIAQALRTGVPVERVHYGNTVKSDRQIAEAYRLGVRDFATDSLADVAAIAEHAPGSRVFCRLATTGEGALWGLSRKFGCSPDEAVPLLAAARDAGLVPSGLSAHVGSQQLTAEAWQYALEMLAPLIMEADRLGIRLDHVNLGGGLPALGVLNRGGQPLHPPVDKMFAVIREGVQHLREVSAGPLDVLLEPGRHLVADHGAIRAHVTRLTERRQLSGERSHWLYLSCGKFNGLYEMDELRYPLEFPTHPGAPTVPAVIAGPSCDSDDAYADEGAGTPVPRDAASGDPVWILSCGAYVTSYTTRGFNGFPPLPYSCVRADPGVRPEESVRPEGTARPEESARPSEAARPENPSPTRRTRHTLAG